MGDKQEFLDLVEQGVRDYLLQNVNIRPETSVSQASRPVFTNFELDKFAGEITKNISKLLPKDKL